MTARLAFKSLEGKNAILGLYDSWLQRWPVPHDTLTVDTRYGKTFIIASGSADAPPLILLHGSSMNSIMWIGEAAEYCHYYRVYAVDLPGEPGHSDERQLPFTGPDFSEWLSDVLDAIGMHQTSLIGLSLGGWVAIKFAVRYPEKVAKLVLLSSAGIGPQRSSFILTALPMMLLGDAGLEKVMRKVNGNQVIPQAVLDYQKLIIKNFNARREVLPLFSDAELRRLTMPVMLMMGKKDVMFYAEKAADRLGSLLPQASITVFPEAGHTLVNLADRIIPWLKSPQ